MRKLVGRFLLSLLLGAAHTGMAQGRVVQSARYLLLRAQNLSTGYSAFGTDDTAPVSGLYNKGITGSSLAGILTANQSTTIDETGAWGTLSAAGGNTSSSIYDYTGWALSKFLADYTVEKPVKYFLRVEGDDISPANASIALVLGPPDPTLQMATWKVTVGFTNRVVLQNKLAGNTYGPRGFSGVLEPGTWRLAMIVATTSDSTRAATFDFEISPLLPIVITRQPTSVNAAVGSGAVLSVGATGDFPTYQWSKNGVVIPGATQADLVFNTAQPTDAGRYTVTVSNPLGNIVSAGADLRVATIKPGIASPPAALSRFAGEPATLSVVATGDGLAFQWNKDGLPIAGATSSTLTLGAFQPAMAGVYTVTVSNGLGSVSSAGATLAVGARLLNLSSRVGVETGGNILIGGFVLGGSKPRKILLRAAGPRLADFGVGDALADPRMTVFDRAGVQIANNDDWSSVGSAGTQQLMDAFQAVGAFPFTTGGKDSALSLTLAPGSYTVHVRGEGETRGVALMEVYDTEAASSESTLINLSTRALVGTGGSILIQGISVQGAAKRLLVRAVGPRLGDFGVPGFLANPVIKIVNSAGVEVAKNDDWGAASATAVQAVADAAAATGAFPLLAGSKDAALVVTLPEGGYSVQVSGVDGATGVALVEVYAF